MRQKEILWFFWMTATVTGGLYELSRMAALVSCNTSRCVAVVNKQAGYLPAEHIETPTERLARLNKHRNIDVGVEPCYFSRMILMLVAVRNHAW